MRWIAAFVAFIFLFPLLLCTSGAEDTRTSFGGEGVYRIRSRSTGLYLTAYLNGSRGVGKAYVTPLEENNEAQIFLLKENDDGSFVIWPQNDSAIYCFAYS